MKFLAPSLQGEETEMSFLDSFITYDSISSSRSPGKADLVGERELEKKGWRRRLWRLTNKQSDESRTSKEQSRVIRRLASLGNLAEGEPPGLEVKKLEAEKKKKDKEEPTSCKQGKSLRKLASTGSLSSGGEKRIIGQKLASTGSLSGGGGGGVGQEIRRRLASSRDRLHSIIK